MATGILPSGRQTSNGRIHYQTLIDNWNARILSSTLPRAGGSQRLYTPNDYFFDRFGSQGNRGPMLLADREMNQFKGRIFDEGVAPQDIDVFQRNLRNAVQTGTGESELLKPLKQVSLTNTKPFLAEAIILYQAQSY